MSLFKKIKFMPVSNLPSNLQDDELYAVPFAISDRNAPNFENKVVLSTGTTYTVGSGPLANYSIGYFMAGCRSRSDDSAPSVNVNGYTAVVMGYDHDYGGDLSGYCIFIPVKTGDYFSIGGSQGSPVVWFLPIKG